MEILKMKSESFKYTTFGVKFVKNKLHREKNLLLLFCPMQKKVKQIEKLKYTIKISKITTK